MFTEEWALKRAVEVAKNSKCKSQRGVVIWNRKIGLICDGWNAPPIPYVCDGSENCKKNCSKTAVHAEQAALLNMLKYPSFIQLAGGINECEMIHVKIVNNEPVMSEKPSCWQCSKLIL